MENEEWRAELTWWKLVCMITSVYIEHIFFLVLLFIIVSLLLFFFLSFFHFFLQKDDFFVCVSVCVCACVCVCICVKKMRIWQSKIVRNYWPHKGFLFILDGHCVESAIFPVATLFEVKNAGKFVILTRGSIDRFELCSKNCNYFENQYIRDLFLAIMGWFGLTILRIMSFWILESMIPFICVCELQLFWTLVPVGLILEAGMPANLSCFDWNWSILSSIPFGNGHFSIIGRFELRMLYTLAFSDRNAIQFWNGDTSSVQFDIFSSSLLPSSLPPFAIFFFLFHVDNGSSWKILTLLLVGLFVILFISLSDQKGKKRLEPFWRWMFVLPISAIFYFFTQQSVFTRCNKLHKNLTDWKVKKWNFASNKTEVWRQVFFLLSLLLLKW